MWQACDLYRCVNGACKSEVLVLRPPQVDSPSFVEPRCICGQPLERVPYGPGDPVRRWSF
jgi:hypothetical protein